MSSSLIPFSFESHSIRTLSIDGNPWFVGKDVAEALGYQDPTTAIRSHCRGVQRLHPIVDSLGRTQDVRIINEPDTYRLISGSTLPEAERFEKWLFEDVLPSIRKTGGYALPHVQPAIDPLAVQLAALLKDKVLVDYGTLGSLARVLYAASGLLKDVESLGLELERQCGKPLIRFDLPASRPSPARHTPAPNPSHDILMQQRLNLDDALLPIITDAGPRGVDHRELCHGCWAYRRATRDERIAALNRLVAQHQIVQRPPLPNGRSPRFVAASQVPVQEAVH